MNYPVFFFYNLLGGIIWSAGLLILGYLLGRIVPEAHYYILPIIILVILFTSLPQIIHVLKNKKNRAEIFNQIKKIFSIKL
jgi:membrane-associated protein